MVTTASATSILLVPGSHEQQTFSETSSPSQGGLVFVYHPELQLKTFANPKNTWQVYAALAICFTFGCIIGSAVVLVLAVDPVNQNDLRITAAGDEWAASSAGSSINYSVLGAPDGAHRLQKPFETSEGSKDEKRADGSAGAPPTSKREELKTSEVKGVERTPKQDIFIKVGKQDTSSPQFVEQLTNQTVDRARMKQSNQRVHLIVKSKMSPEVTTAVDTALTDEGIQLFSARYKVTASNYTGILQVPIWPAEVVHVLWELPHVAETSELSLKIVFGKFPEYMTELTLEIIHKNVKKILNLDDIKELCATGRFSYGKSPDEATYLISCKFTE